MEDKSSVNFHGFGSGNAGGPIDSWLNLREKRAETGLLYLKFYSLSFASVLSQSDHK
jgi:hypothetical protein